MFLCPHLVQVVNETKLKDPRCDNLSRTSPPYFITLGNYSAAVLIISPCAAYFDAARGLGVFRRYENS